MLQRSCDEAEKVTIFFSFVKRCHLPWYSKSMESIDNLIVRLHCSSCPKDLRDLVIERLRELSTEVSESREELDHMHVKLNELSKWTW